ncbi:MAG TPA: terminase large subunit [Burkholderiales bacterium]|nr:terminase large subunit [Burkholderiales bacterium]
MANATEDVSPTLAGVDCVLDRNSKTLCDRDHAPARADYVARAESYARRVIAGDILACKWVKAACQRQLDDLARVAARDEAWPFYFDCEEAIRWCQFVELMPHVKGDLAKPERTEEGLVYPKIVLEDAQAFFIAVLFGWLRVDNRLRRFRRAYLEEARKNTKSTLLAALALGMLAIDGEEGPEVYTAATKKDQAKIIWEEVACEMVRRQPEFKQLGVAFNKSRMYCTRNGGKFTPLARDYGSLDGLNTSCFISDEMHAQKDRGLYDVLDSSTGGRSQPLGIGITTAGTDRSGVCYAQRSYLVKILNAVLHRHGGLGYTIKGGTAEDETYFGLIYTLDDSYGDKRADDDWGDEAVWAKANPMLLATHNAAYAAGLLADLRAQCRRALSMPSEQSEFRTKRCNQWLNADVAWMDMAAWRRCEDAELAEDEFTGADCIAALDAAFKTDLFAKVKLFEKSGHYYAFGRYYAPARMLNLKGNDHLKSWAEHGLIVETPGEVVDIEAVREDLIGTAALVKRAGPARAALIRGARPEVPGDAGRHNLTEIAFDPAQLTQFAGEMIEDGYTMVEMRPTVLNFSEPMKFLEELVLQGKFHHDGDPVLEWMISNVVCHRDRKDNIYPNKERPENKIDGVIGLLMTLARRIANPVKESVYKTRGLVSVG